MYLYTCIYYPKIVFITDKDKDEQDRLPHRSFSFVDRDIKNSAYISRQKNSRKSTNSFLSANFDFSIVPE